MLTARTARAPTYGGVAKSFHWLILALLALQFAIAWTMPGVRGVTQPEGLLDLHLSIGVVILALALLRLLWRLVFPVPLIGDHMPLWQRRAAQATHALLYLLLVIVPFVGWADASARGWQIDVFGSLNLPPVLAANSPWGGAASDLHSFLAYSLLTLVGLHAAAALYHHFWLRDHVLERMLPGDR